MHYLHINSFIKFINASSMLTSDTPIKIKCVYAPVVKNILSHKEDTDIAEQVTSGMKQNLSFQIL